MSDGFVAKGFEEVRAAFDANFAERGEVGAAVAVYRDGVPVVDLWGGQADATAARPWTEDTIVPVFSSTKGVTAVCANLLIERGVLDVGAPVVTWWPEFGAAGKAGITLGQLLSHQAGLPLVEGEMSLEEALSWDPVVERLAGQAPLWEPGAGHGYHMRTYGWLVGEVIRRATARTVGTFLRDEIAGPLGLDTWIGLPESEEHRVGRLVPPRIDLAEVLAPLAETLLLARVFSSPGGHFNYDEMWNSRALHAGELPSSNGITDARSLARLYASIVGDGVEGLRTLAPATMAVASEERACGPDLVLGADTCFGLGFMLGASFGAANPATAVGHAGAGGSLAFADPAAGIGFGYVMNDLRFDMAGDPRSEELVRAVYASLG